MNELQVMQPTEIIITNEHRALVKQTIFPDANEAELELFFYDCRRRGTHPLDKLIHPTKRGGRYVPITSIDMFRMRAGEAGDHAGTDEAVFSGDGPYPEKATVTVWKFVQGQRCAFPATARWAEYYPGDGKEGFMWRKMPCVMLGKCAEALALRRAFPKQLHGLYITEELDQAKPPSTLNIPQVRPPSGDHDYGKPELPRDNPFDDPYPKPSKQEDGLSDSAALQARGGSPQPQPVSQDAPAHIAPAVKSAAEMARAIADKMDEQYDDGIIGKLQPYAGTKAYQKGCKPGYFDLEDGQGGLVRKFKFMDPDLDISSGMKRVYYRTETYQGKTSYAVTKIEALD